MASGGSPVRGADLIYNLVLVAAAFAIRDAVLRVLPASPVVPIKAPWVVDACTRLLISPRPTSSISSSGGRQRTTISLSEVGLVIGLYVLSPLSNFWPVTLLGAAASLIFVRRQRAAKLVFNLAQLCAFTTSLAVIVFAAVESRGDPSRPLSGGRPSCSRRSTACLFGIVLVTIAIAIAERLLSLRQLPTNRQHLADRDGRDHESRADRDRARKVRDSGTIVLLVVPAADRGRCAPCLLREGPTPRALRVPLRVDENHAGRGAESGGGLRVGQLLSHRPSSSFGPNTRRSSLLAALRRKRPRSTLGRSEGMTSQSGPARALRHADAPPARGRRRLCRPARDAPRRTRLDSYLAARFLNDGIIATLRGERGLDRPALVVGDRSGDVESF